MDDPDYPRHPNYRNDPDGLDNPDWPPDDPADAANAGRHRIPPPGPKRWKRYTTRIGAGLGVVVLLLAGYLGYEYWRLNGNIQRVDVLETDDSNIRDAEKQKHAQNFLLIGSDTREGENSQYGEAGGARSDTTILAHLSPNHDKAILISFPRDAWVTVPECEGPDGETVPEQENQFNAAFQIGGPNCTIRTVQKLTGIAVNHYLQVDFTGFKSMVDALGGVEICSTEDAFDKDSGLELTEGNNKLGGEQALAYVRARYGLGDGSDIDRIERQQRFLGALMRTATSGGVLTNPIKLRDFLTAVTDSLTMDRDTGLGDLKSLAEGLNGLDPSKVSFVTPPIANRDYDPTGEREEGGGRVLLDETAGRVLYDSIISDKDAPPSTEPTATQAPAAPTPPTITVAPDDVSVQVFNGVGEPGLASQARDDLVAAGFTIAGEPDTRVTGAAESVVRYAPGQIESARTLASAVPGSVLQEDASLTGEYLELEVGSSYDGVQQVSVGSPDTSGNSSAPAAPGPGNGPVLPSDAISAADTTCI